MLVNTQPRLFLSILFIDLCCVAIIAFPRNFTFHISDKEVANFFCREWQRHWQPLAGHHEE